MKQIRKRANEIITSLKVGYDSCNGDTEKIIKIQKRKTHISLIGELRGLIFALNSIDRESKYILHTNGCISLEVESKSRFDLLEELRREVKELDSNERIVNYTFEGIQEIADKHQVQGKELYLHIAEQNYVISSR